MEPGLYILRTFDALSLVFKFLSAFLFIDLFHPLGILNKKYEIMKLMQ